MSNVPEPILTEQGDDLMLLRRPSMYWEAYDINDLPALKLRFQGPTLIDGISGDDPLISGS